MDDLGFDVRLERLSSNLRETAALLRQYGETRWLTWADACSERLANHDAAALDRVLSVFGGMGSLNDLVLVTGESGGGVEQAAANELLGTLRDTIWHDATVLRHDLRSST